MLKEKSEKKEAKTKELCYLNQVSATHAHCITYTLCKDKKRKYIRGISDKMEKIHNKSKCFTELSTRCLKFLKT